VAAHTLMLTLSCLLKVFNVHSKTNVSLSVE